jgi:transposase
MVASRSTRSCGPPANYLVAQVRPLKTKAVSHSPNLADSTLRSYARKLDTDLDALLRIKPKHEGKKFRAIIKDCRQNLFVFMKNRAITPTNNCSEQAIRPCVTFRKVTNCFRSEWGAKLYADIRSTLETARRRAIGALQAIRLTLDDKPLLDTG